MSIEKGVSEAFKKLIQISLGSFFFLEIFFQWIWMSTIVA